MLSDMKMFEEIIEGHRYDYILIWGNGLQYGDEIVQHIRAHPDFDVIHILTHKPKSISVFVKAVYSFDYAPFWHLEAKTQYLLSTAPEVKLVVFKNNNPDEDYLGEGEFRHLESMTIKRFKDKLRDLYNERKNDRRSENHVIHATDNQKQTDYILKYLGYENGLKTILDYSNDYLKSPWHLGDISRFTLEQVDINDIRCRLISKGKSITAQVEDSPHYNTLVNNNNCYGDYVNQHQGVFLLDNHSVAKFKELADKFEYLSEGHGDDYILVIKENGIYIVCDGLHRLAILKFQKAEKLLVAVLK
jgi:hypothetical protein